MLAKTQTLYHRRLLLCATALFLLLLISHIRDDFTENSPSILPFVAAKGTTKTSRKRAKVERDVRRLRQDCEETPKCAVLPPHENVNCINQCLSATCYEKIFGESPLEDG